MRSLWETTSKCCFSSSRGLNDKRFKIKMSCSAASGAGGSYLEDTRDRNKSPGPIGLILKSLSAYAAIRRELLDSIRVSRNSAARGLSVVVALAIFIQPALASAEAIAPKMPIVFRPEMFLAPHSIRALGDVPIPQAHLFATLAIFPQVLSAPEHQDMVDRIFGNFQVVDTLLDLHDDEREACVPWLKQQGVKKYDPESIIVNLHKMARGLPPLLVPGDAIPESSVQKITARFNPMPHLIRQLPPSLRPIPQPLSPRFPKYPISRAAGALGVRAAGFFIPAVDPRTGVALFVAAIMVGMTAVFAHYLSNLETHFPNFRRRPSLLPGLMRNYSKGAFAAAAFGISQIAPAAAFGLFGALALRYFWRRLPADKKQAQIGEMGLYASTIFGAVVLGFVGGLASMLRPEIGIASGLLITVAALATAMSSRAAIGRFAELGRFFSALLLRSLTAGIYVVLFLAQDAIPALYFITLTGLVFYGLSKLLPTLNS